MKRPNWHDQVFFGLHFDLHATDQDTELGKDLTEEHLIEQLQKIKPDFVQCDCKGHPGYTSYPTKVGAPSPGIVKDAVRMWRDATRQLGIPLGMHYSGVWDAAALKKHPEWGRVNAVSSQLNTWPKQETGTDNRDLKMTCPKSDYTDMYMIPQLLEIIDNYDVDGFWVDGENWASAPCYCELCREGFNAKVGRPVDAPETPDQPLWTEWLAYSRENFVDHVRRYGDAIHARKPGCTVCSNWMYTVRQPEPIDAPIDYISGDFSWIWSAEKATVEARFMDSRNISWDLMAWAFSSHGKMQDWVFKTADALCQEAGVVMACGGAFMIYDTPNRSGTLVDWHMNELAKVAAFCRARQPYCQNTTAVPQIVLLHSPDHYYAHNSPLFNLSHATDPIEGALHALLENNYAVEIRNTEDLFSRLESYPMVVISEQDNLRPELIPQLIAYVNQGGHLIVCGNSQTAQFDEWLGVSELGSEASPDAQAESAGDQAKSLYIPYDKGAVVAMGDWRLVKPVDAMTRVIEPLLLTRDTGSFSRPSGACAATVRTVGKGCLAGIYGPAFSTYAYSHYPAVRNFIGKVLNEMATPRLLRVDAPARIQVSLREQDNHLMINLVNMGADHPLSPKSPLVETVPPAGPVRLFLPLATQPRQVLLMPSAVPVDWYYSDGLLTVCVDQVGIHDILVIDR